MRTLLSVIALTTACLGTTVSVAAEHWNLAREEDGIQVFLSKVPGSRYQSFRGVTDIKASAATLRDLQENLRVACKWLYGRRQPDSPPGGNPRLSATRAGPDPCAPVERPVEDATQGRRRDRSDLSVTGRAGGRHSLLAGRQSVRGRCADGQPQDVAGGCRTTRYTPSRKQRRCPDQLDRRTLKPSIHSRTMTE